MAGVTKADTAIVYLARGRDGGAAAAGRFLASHRAHPPGASHRLVVALKGWAGVEGQDAVAEAARGHGAELIALDDDGFDLGAYIRIASRLETAFLCCLNTHSEILAPHWLRHLRQALDRPGCGVAGATGSHASHRMPHALRRSMLAAASEGGPRFGRLLREARLALVEKPRALLMDRGWPAFPNPHLRTNAFLLPRETLLAFAARHAFPVRKQDAWRMESGAAGLTAHVAAAGQLALVADRDGRSLASEDWPASATFRAYGQRGLIVADNQTRRYAAASRPLQRMLEIAAWGRALDGAAAPQVAAAR